MTYTPSWSVAAGDTPSAAKWNQLGANDDNLRARTQTGWRDVTDSWTYSSADTTVATFVITVPSDATATYTAGMRVKLNQSQAYTNDPAAGSNIVLNMTDTSGFIVGDLVTVSSSAGTETATITVIVANTSITVNTLALNHTTSSPLVTATKYFIVTAVSATTLTLYGGTLYALANSAITLPYFSSEKIPFGFNADPAIWQQKLSDTSSRDQASPSTGTWYNTGSLSLAIPIGIWNVSYSAEFEAIKNTSTNIEIYITLSSANNSQSDTEFTSHFQATMASANNDYYSNVYKLKPLTLTVKTTYYLNLFTGVSSMNNLRIRGDATPTIVRAVCAYL